MLKKLLKCAYLGAERNILCYDEFAHQGEFTRRLVVLMKYISIENNDLPPLSKIYVSRMGFRQIFCWNHNPSLDLIEVVTNETIYDESQYIIQTMSIQIKISDDLGLIWEKNKSGFGSEESYGNIMYVYDKLGSSIQSDDRELVIGLSSDCTNVILGSF